MLRALIVGAGDVVDYNIIADEILKRLGRLRYAK